MVGELHLGQAARLFDLQAAMCRIVLNDLVRHGQPQSGSNRHYRRAVCNG